MKYFAILLTLISATAHADQSAWQHRELTSTTGTVTRVDYELETTHPSSGEVAIDAAPVWINVTRPGAPLLPADQVRVLVTTWDYGAAKASSSGARFSGETLDLGWAGDGRFTAAAQPLALTRANESGGMSYKVKLALVVNGVWQDDSDDGRRDFLLNLFGP